MASDRMKKFWIVVTAIAAVGAVVFALAIISKVSDRPVPVVTKIKKALSTAPPWVLTFDEKRRVQAPDYPTLVAALANSQVGDVIQLKDGVTYRGGDIRITRGDVKIFCEKGQRCTIEDYLLMDAPRIWLEGIEYKAHPYKNINFFSGNGAIVNCVITGDGGQDQVGVFANADTRVANSVMVFYGNIVSKAQYGIYSQSKKGFPKYYVNNYLADVTYPSQPWVIHNYAQSPNKVEDMHYLDNVITTGAVLNGGQGDIAAGSGGTPPIEIEFKKNVFYKTSTQGFKRPFNLQFVDNMFFRSQMKNEFMWGVGEGWFQYPSTPFTVTGNVFWNPGADQIYYQTSIYPCNNCTREDGKAKFRSSDVVDGNQFFGGFSASMDANGGHLQTTNIGQWQNLTEANGLKMEGSSSVNPNVPPNGYKLTANDYDADRAMLTVWNWNASPSVSVSLPRPADLFTVKDVYGAPVKSVPAGNVSLDQPGEFEVYLVKYKSEPPAGCNCDLNAADAELVKALGYVDAGQKKKAKTAINNARTIIAPCKK